MIIAFKLRVYFSFVLFVVAASSNYSTDTSYSSRHSYVFYGKIVRVFDASIVNGTLQLKNVKHGMKAYSGITGVAPLSLTGALDGVEW
jgi:hypothetical protein